jgi:hypothetical protein
MGRFKSLTQWVLKVSNKSVREAEELEKLENARRRAKTKRKSSSE